MSIFQVAEDMKDRLNTFLKLLRIKNDETLIEMSKKLDLKSATSLNCVVFTDEVVDVTPVIQYNNVLAPIAEGQVVGSITYTIDGIDYKSDLIATHDVYSSNVMNIILILFVVFAILLVLVTFISIKKK